MFHCANASPASAAASDSGADAPKVGACTTGTFAGGPGLRGSGAADSVGTRPVAAITSSRRVSSVRSRISMVDV